MAPDAPGPERPTGVEPQTVHAVRDVLIGAAGEQRLVTYDSLVAEVAPAGEGLAEMLRSRMADVLRAVSIESDQAGRGLLTAIVVRDDTGRPGRGFFRLAADRGRDVADEHVAWVAEVDRVFTAYTR